MLLIAGFVLLFLLPTPWNLVAFLAGLLLWLGEVFIIWRLVRRKQVQAGAETLVGRTATVIVACRPWPGAPVRRVRDLARPLRGRRGQG